MAQRKKVWLDCDPGHDDACAIVLAGHHKSLELLGISTVFGNQSLEKTTQNALNVLAVSGLENIDVVKGSARPIMRAPAICPSIHGDSGLDSKDPSAKFPPTEKKALETNAIVHIFNTIWNSSEPVTIIATGCLTNIALLLRVFPQVVSKIESIVLLGGCMGIGNMGPVMEWNIMIDPEAAHIVFESGLKVVQVPLEVTHTVLVTREIFDTLNAWNTPYSLLFSSLLSFFEETYRLTFGFEHGPPLHDPVAVAYVIHPELFETKFVHVAIETQSSFTSGQTICDIHHVTKKPPNVHLAMKVDVQKFWGLMMDAFKEANNCSAMNKK